MLLYILLTLTSGKNNIGNPIGKFADNIQMDKMKHKIESVKNENILKTDETTESQKNANQNSDIPELKLYVLYWLWECNKSNYNWFFVVSQILAQNKTNSRPKIGRQRRKSQKDARQKQRAKLKEQYQKDHIKFAGKKGGKAKHTKKKNQMHVQPGLFSKRKRAELKKEL